MPVGVRGGLGYAIHQGSHVRPGSVHVLHGGLSIRPLIREERFSASRNMAKPRRPDASAGLADDPALLIGQFGVSPAASVSLDAGSPKRWSTSPQTLGLSVSDGGPMQRS